MANTLTDLAADIYKAADIVGRELVGYIPSVTVNGGSEAAALNGTVRAAFTREATAVTTTPAMTIPEGTDQTVDNKTLTLATAKSVQIPWTGEDIKYVNSGAGFETIYGDQIKQAMRTLTNLMEVDIATAAYKAASRAYGTAGTTPFASNFNEVAQMRKILVDNGMPTDDGMATMVINSTAGVNLRNLANLQKVNEAGGSELLRQGTLLDLQGLMFKESAKVQSVGASTITANVTVTGANAVGATTINVTTDGTGAVSIPAGGVITIAGDTNKYVVPTATTIGSSTTGDIVIAEPGLQIATSGSEAVSGTAAYSGNSAFHRSAIELAVRPMETPLGGDAAVDMMTVEDPFSGLVYQISVYKGFKKAMINVDALWGVKAWKPEFIATLFG